MMRVVKTGLVALVLAVFGAGCAREGKPAPASLRVVNAMPDAAQVTVALRGPDERREEVAFATATDDFSLRPGRYEVTVHHEGRLLLRQAFGFPPEARFTLLIEGYSELSTEPNQRTTGAMWHRVFAGAESTHPNGYLPRFALFRDEAGSAPDKSALRVVNAVPGAQPLRVRLADSNAALVDALRYPARSPHVMLDPGEHRMEIGLASMSGALLVVPLHTEACAAYTLAVLGSVDGQALQALVLGGPAGCGGH